MERIYVIPLRKEFLKAPMHNRTSKSVRALKQFIQKHMKVETVKIGPHLNKLLWSRGNRHPPHKVEVRAEKTEDKENYCFVELASVPKEEPKEKKVKKEVKEEEISETKEEEQAEELEEEKQEVLMKEEHKEKIPEEQPKPLKKEDQEKIREKQIIKKDFKRKK